MLRFQLLIGLVLPVWTPPAAAATADLVLLHGRIATLDPGRPVAQALAVSGDRISAVGCDQEIQALVSPATTVIDLRGALAIPAFIEGHGHFLALGEARLQPDLSAARDWNEVVRQVAAAAAGKPGEWIVGQGWHQEKWAHGGEPHHQALSRAVPDNPVILYHASGHSAVANSRAMDLAGVKPGTPSPAGGEIVRDAAGNPTGLFRENAVLLLEQARERSRSARSATEVEAELMTLAGLAERECLRNGVASFQDAGASFAVIDFYRRFVAQGKPGVRLWVMISEENRALASKLQRYRTVGAGGNRLTVRAIKRLMDGALGSHGAWLLAPYRDRPESSGLNVTPPAAIEETARLAIANGFQLCTHAIGDRAVRETLDVYERAFGSHAGETDLRFRIEHAQHIDPADLPRFARLGVIASMQGIHCTSDGPWVPKRLGEERSREGAYPWRSLLVSGAVVANGTDTPVEPVNPIAGIDALVTRRMKDGTAFHPAQRLSREEALRTYTLGAAYAAFEEDIKGSLRVGKLADIVVLSQDILSVPEEQIRSTEVTLTIVGGKVLYRR